MWKPDRTLAKPVYQQIVAHLEQSIALGELPPGSILPSERKLAERYSVNRSTVVRAYEELRAAGLVESTMGSGTRVSLTLWGINRSQAPNWRQYTEGGAFLPHLPLMRRIREVSRQEQPIIDMASGELSADLFPNEIVSRLLQQSQFREHLGYDDPQGYRPLRNELSAMMQRLAKIDATADSILVTSGSQQSLYLITQCLLSPGDAVAIEAPSYAYSLPMLQSAGLRIFQLPVQPDGIDPEDLFRLHKQHRIRMAFVNPTYQNPTGTVLSLAKRRRLLAIASELRIPLVEDDPFSLTGFAGSPPASLKSLDKDGIVLYIGSLSKIAASGLRVGWLIAPRSVIERLADARQQMDFGLSIIAQWAAERLLASGHFYQHLLRLRQALLNKQQLMAAAAADVLQDRVSFAIPQGGLHLWGKVNHLVEDGKLLEEAIKHGLVYVPGSVYGSPPGYLRLSYSKPKSEEIAAGIHALGRALSALGIR